jgi:hypothetical protein
MSIVSGGLAIWICVHPKPVGASLHNRLGFCLSLVVCILYDNRIGGYDSSVHMSEEASNAASVIPWAIVSSCWDSVAVLLMQTRLAPLEYLHSLAGVRFCSLASLHI